MGSVSGFKYFLFLDLFFLFLCFSGILQIKEKASLPFTLKSYKNTLSIAKINKGFNSPGEGDILLSIDSLKFSSPEELEVLLDGRKSGEQVVIKYIHSGTALTKNVTLENHYTTPDIIIYSFSGILFLITGLITVLKSNHKKAAQLFYWGCSGAALIIILTPGSYAALPYNFGFVTRFIFHLAYCITPVIFVHFILNFPLETKASNRIFLSAGYFFALLLSSVLTFTFIRGVINNSPQQISEYIWIYNTILRVFVLINFSAAVLLFIYSYRRMNSVPDKKKLKWILYGLVVGPLSYVVFWVLPYIFFERGILPEFLVIGLLSAVPVTFAIAIVRYHFFDIDFIINRSIVYLIVVGSLITLYLFLFTIISLSLKDINETIPAVISVSAAALLLQPVKRKIQLFVDRKFFRIQYNYREALKKFLEEIDNCFDLNSLAEKVVKKINEFIPVEKIGFFELQPGDKIKLVAQNNFELLTNRLVAFKRQELKINILKPVTIIEHVEDAVDAVYADPKVFNRWGISLAFTLTSQQNEIFGFLVLGRKKSGFRFTVEDIDLLDALRSKIATTMERNKYHSELLIEQFEKQKLTELNEMKSFFVSSVSHDLKTPITSIKLFTDMLKEINKTSDKALNYLNIIEGESDRLTRLIDNVLDYTKIEKGVKEYTFEKISLEKLVKETLGVMQYQLAMNKFNCEVNISRDENLICCDNDAVKESLLNLISNAIKYSGENKKIFIRTFSGKGFAGVEVQDSGIGISKDELKNIFEPFFRSKYLKGKKIGGTGIGLSIVKHIMDAHKGKIEVNSEPGKGSCFSLIFPVSDA